MHPRDVILVMLDLISVSFGKLSLVKGPGCQFLLPVLSNLVYRPQDLVLPWEEVIVDVSFQQVLRSRGSRCSSRSFFGEQLIATQVFPCWKAVGKARVQLFSARMCL